MLSIEGVSKVLGGRKVLSEVSLQAEPGQIVALLGENGAGKSTLLRIVAGILDADAGRAKLHGASLLGGNAPARARIGFVPEAADAPPHLSPRLLLTLVASLKRAPLPDPALLAQLGIEPYLDQPLGGLSLGQRRRSCLAAALVGGVQLLLLDEPTNGLDAAGMRMLVEVLADRTNAGTIMLIATHDEAFASATKVTRYRLAGGRIQRGA